MRDNPKDVRSIVQWKITKPKAEDDQVMGQPAKTEEDSHNDDHSGDLAFALLRIRHIFHGVHRCPEITDGPQVGETQNQHWNDITEDKCAQVHNFALRDFPNRMTDCNIGYLELLVVTNIRSREDERKPPDETNSRESIPGSS